MTMEGYVKIARVVCFGAGVLLLGSYLSSYIDLIGFALKHGLFDYSTEVFLSDFLLMAIVVFSVMRTSDVLPVRRLALTIMAVSLGAIGWQIGERSSFINCSSLLQFLRPDDSHGCYAHSLWKVGVYLTMLWVLSVISLLLITIGKRLQRSVD